jgi:hypothetical protein
MPVLRFGRGASSLPACGVGLPEGHLAVSLGDVPQEAFKDSLAGFWLGWDPFPSPTSKWPS